MKYTIENYNFKELKQRLKAMNKSLPMSYNYNDYKRLWVCQTEEEIRKEFTKINDEIFRVGKANLSINHSNFSVGNRHDAM